MPHSGMFLTDFERNAEHTCKLPSIEEYKLDKKHHGLVWQCTHTHPDCWKAYRFNAQRMKWYRLRPWHFDWWRYVFFG